MNVGYYMQWFFYISKRVKYEAYNSFHDFVYITFISIYDAISKVYVNPDNDESDEMRQRYSFFSPQFFKIIFS